MVDATVHLIERGHVRADAGHVVEGFSMATASDPEPEPTRGAGPVYNLVIDHPEGTILWDTGSHPEAGNGHWPGSLYDRFEHHDADEHRLDDQLEAAGFGIEDVDAVIATHLHMDHAGGLYHFAGTDVPVYVHEEEIKQAYYAAKTDEFRSPYVAADFDHDLDWQVVYGRREQHFSDLEFLHLPGHTPGLLGVLLHLDSDASGEGDGSGDSGDQESHLFVGDQADARVNYDHGAPLGPLLLWDRPAWFESLHWLYDLERRHDASVYCGHDADDVERLRGGLG